MAIHIERAGERFGPYSQAEVRKHLASGDLKPSDLAWQSGMAEWTLLASMFPGVRAYEDASRSSAPGTRPPRPAKKYGRVVTTFLVMLAIAYVISPYYSLWRLHGALDSGDEKGLEARIDFASVRVGLKKDMKVHMERAVAKGNDSSFAGLLGSIAGQLMEGMIDSVVTPRGVAGLLGENKASEKEPQATPAKSSGEEPEISDIDYAFFTSPTRFLVEVDKVKVRMRLSSSGWKVTRVEIPPEVFESALK